MPARRTSCTSRVAAAGDHDPTHSESVHDPQRDTRSSSVKIIWPASEE